MAYASNRTEQDCECNGLWLLKKSVLAVRECRQWDYKQLMKFG